VYGDWQNQPAREILLAHRKGWSRAALFLLMAILSQAFFALVRSHLMAFSFLSAGHCCEIIKGLDINIVVICLF